MNEAVVLGLMKDALWVTFLVAAPILGVTLVVGIIISIIQALTQVNEQTLTYVPKFVAVFAVLVIFGPWMMETLLGFTTTLFTNMGQYGK